ncbi:MAG: M48 family metalloprotease [Syntrophorhabdaceae bacterium]|nr:M48 family metalloprotease [Syntrophorhabdaceae bacterium]
MYLPEPATKIRTRNNIKRFFIVFAVIMGIMAGGEAQAVNPLTSTEFDPVFIGEGSEIEIGKNTDQQLRSKYRISTDQQLNQRINAIGQRLAAQSERKNLKYTFTVINDELVNAFAAPGGYVYITTGILHRLKNDDEIASVLAHEIGHVVNKHSLKAIQRQMLAQFGLQIMGAMLGDGGISGTLLVKASEISASLLLLKNSRVNELESDAEGVEIMRRAGYNPRAMIDVQRMLLGVSGGKNPPAIISTHPPSQERIDAIQRAIDNTR